MIQAVRRRGLCAGIYYAEEIGVMSPEDKTFSENFDLILSSGRPWRGMNAHRATCRPGTIVGPASDPINGPFR